MVGRHAHMGTSPLAEALFLPSVRRAEIDHRAAVERIIEFVELEGLRYAEASALPFGSQKIVGLARALAQEPTILLLDEPSAGLSRDERDDLAAHRAQAYLTFSSDRARHARFGLATASRLIMQTLLRLRSSLDDLGYRCNLGRAPPTPSCRARISSSPTLARERAASSACCCREFQGMGKAAKPDRREGRNARETRSLPLCVGNAPT